MARDAAARGRTCYTVLVAAGCCGGVALVATLTAVLWVSGYDSFTAGVARLAAVPNHLAELRAAWLPPHRFRDLRWLTLASLVIAVLVPLGLRRRLRPWRDASYAATVALAHVPAALYREFSPRGRILLVVLLVAVAGLRLADALAFPVTYDEAFTYLHFSSQSAFVSLSYYPAPNNHVLYSLAATPVVRLPLPATFALRLPAVVASLLTTFFLAGLLRRQFSEAAAFPATALHAILFGSAYYGILARGYGFTLLFLVLALLGVERIQRGQAGAGVWAVVAGTLALGLHAVPSFLYAAVTVLVFLAVEAGLRRGRRGLLGAAVTAAATVLLAAMLYGPVLLVSGLAAVISNPTVRPGPRAEVLARLPAWIFQQADWMVGKAGMGAWALGACLLVALAALALSPGHRSAARWVLLALLGGPVLLALHSVTPYHRTFVHQTVTLSWGMALAIELVAGRRRWLCWLSLAAATMLVVAAGANSLTAAAAVNAPWADQRWIVETLVAHDVRSVYVEADVDEVMVVYGYRSRDLPLAVDCGRDQWGRGLDTARAYDAIVVRGATAAQPDRLIRARPDLGERYRPILHTAATVVFLRVGL